MQLWPKRGLRLLAGCAPCQPFSSFRRGTDTKGDEKWPLLDEFRRLVEATRPELVTMENVPGLKSTEVFARFVRALEDVGYSVAYKSCYGPKYGLPQHRRRLVLLASLLGPIGFPAETNDASNFVTVKDVIAGLPKLQAGQADPADPLHKARSLTPLNLARIRASKPGGTWRDWPSHLRSPCHTRATGASFQSVYARMTWSEPAPTITTQAYNFGTGRFGHPDQDRAISLREAAMLQGFPRDYAFVRPDAEPEFLSIGRLIGNAVPPPLGRAIGEQISVHTKVSKR